MVEVVSVYTGVEASLLRKRLYIGTVTSFIGVLLLVYGSLFLDIETLKVWGLPIFFTFVGCLMMGMLPYQRLRAIQNQPDRFFVSDGGECTYYRRGVKTLTIPSSMLKDVKYQKRGDLYGMALDLNEDSHERIVIHQKQFDLERYQKWSKKRYDCMLFFPYFGRKACQSVREASYTETT